MEPTGRREAIVQGTATPAPEAGHRIDALTRVASVRMLESRSQGKRTALLAALLCALVLCLLAELTPASAKDRLRAIHYRGQAIEVPASWPVHRLATDPTRCVRFDRRAVYLGRPSPEQRCPAHATGRARAILVEPKADGGARRVAANQSAPAPTRDRAVGRAAGRAQASATYYTGLGFDACSAPPVTTMAAWLSSPYRAIGVYIGGANRGCSQPNLTSDWVAAQIAAGWQLIPTYVGLQAPANSCGCAGIKPNQAAAQGTVAADDAVLQAGSLGIGPGNPIYFDMEGYSRTTANSSAVLTFLGAWTERLHQRGYVSGVYGSASSTISDLVSQYGLGYSEPDDVWIAHWDGIQTTSDAYVPASNWSNHQRLRQYRGGHKETYGGVSLNIDNDYIDGAVVGSASPVPVRIKCRRVIFSHRPVSGAFKIRGFNFSRCEKARRVATTTRRSSFAASGRARAYSKKGFACTGRRVGPARVTYQCRQRNAKVIFVRKGLGR